MIMGDQEAGDSQHIAVGGQPPIKKPVKKNKRVLRYLAFSALVLVLAIPIIWTLMWWGARSVALSQWETVQADLAAEGTELTCKKHGIIGFPFEFRAECSSFALLRSAVGNKGYNPVIRLKRVRALLDGSTILAFFRWGVGWDENPILGISFALDGPLSISGGVQSQPYTTLDWNDGDVFVGVKPALMSPRINGTFRNIIGTFTSTSASAKSASRNKRTPISVRIASLHLVVMEAPKNPVNNLDIAFDASEIREINLMNTGADLSARVTVLDFHRWMATSGQPVPNQSRDSILDRVRLDSEGASANVSGPVRLNSRDEVSGELNVVLLGVDKISSMVQRISGVPSFLVREGLKAFGPSPIEEQGRSGITFDLKINNNRLGLSDGNLPSPAELLAPLKSLAPPIESLAPLKSLAPPVESLAPLKSLAPPSQLKKLFGTSPSEKE